MADIIYSDEANADITNIILYYMSKFGADTADKVINSILDRIDILQAYPESGNETNSKRLNEQGCKKLVTESHVVIYTYEKNENVVNVHHIYRESEDY